LPTLCRGTAAHTTAAESAREEENIATLVSSEALMESKTMEFGHRCAGGRSSRGSSSCRKEEIQPTAGDVGMPLYTAQVLAEFHSQGGKTIICKIIA
jgi:hypothetical protein